MRELCRMLRAGARGRTRAESPPVRGRPVHAQECLPVDGRLRPASPGHRDLRRVHGDSALVLRRKYALRRGSWRPGLQAHRSRHRRALAFAVLFVVVYRVVAAGVASRRRTASLIAACAACSCSRWCRSRWPIIWRTTSRYLLIQGQLVISLASDPFGFGWNLFGTAAFVPDSASWMRGAPGTPPSWRSSSATSWPSTSPTWSRCASFATASAVVRSQLVMLVLMVGYTTASLWIIAQPIVESRGAG